MQVMRWVEEEPPNRVSLINNDSNHSSSRIDIRATTEIQVPYTDVTKSNNQGKEEDLDLVLAAAIVEVDLQHFRGQVRVWAEYKFSMSVYSEKVFMNQFSTKL